MAVCFGGWRPIAAGSGKLIQSGLQEGRRQSCLRLGNRRVRRLNLGERLRELVVVEGGTTWMVNRGTSAGWLEHFSWWFG